VASDIAEPINYWKGLFLEKKDDGFFFRNDVDDG